MNGEAPGFSPGEEVTSRAGQSAHSRKRAGCLARGQRAKSSKREGNGTVRVIHGDFLEGLRDPDGIVLASTCGVITRGGRLVMGAGAARALAHRFSGLADEFGRLVRLSGVFRGDHWVYGLVVTTYRGYLVGAFQTKGHWRDPSSLDLVRFSASKLGRYLEANPDIRVHMAYPGIGLGGLGQEDVSRVLEEELGPVLTRVSLYILPRGTLHI